MEIGARVSCGLVLGLAVCLAGCPLTPCGPKNCSTCCRGGYCVYDVSSDACGHGGEACVDCGLGENRCVEGACTPCAADNCAGCCDGPACRLGEDRAQCGAEGAQCTDCAALGQVCTTSQYCEACGPGNCAGCCLADGTCQYEPTRAACGTDGAACVDCVADHLFCHDGACVECGADTCTGCCLTDGDCNLEETASACGLGGVVCDDCLSRGLMCTWYGVHQCVDCVAQTCAGCCDPQGQCKVGAADKQCGYNAHACEDCTASGLRCDNAICR